MFDFSSYIEEFSLSLAFEKVVHGENPNERDEFNFPLEEP